MGSNPTAFALPTAPPPTAPPPEDAAPGTGSRFFDGPAGRLDARLHGPQGGDPVLLLHPHPRFGGTMGSRLTYDLATGLGAAGHLAVRFDFRGVGRSEGEGGDGAGEVEDAIAVWDALRKETGQAPAVIGHSFGGGVAARMATRRSVPRLVLVATPPRVRGSRLAPIEDAPDVPCPVSLIVGDKDPLVSVEDMEALQAALPECRDLRVLEGAGHFLTPDHTDRVLRHVLRMLGGAP